MINARTTGKIARNVDDIQPWYTSPMRLRTRMKFFVILKGLQEQMNKNEMMQIKVKKLDDRSILPRKAHATDSCFDLFAYKYNWAEGLFSVGYIAYTGISVEIPSGYYGQLLTPSSMIKHGITVMGGVVDSGYHGEINVLLTVPVPDDGDSTCMDAYKSVGELINDYIKHGTPIAQLAILPVPQFEIIESDSLSPSESGENEKQKLYKNNYYET